MDRRPIVLGVLALSLVIPTAACAPGSSSSDSGSPSAPASVDFGSFKGKELTYVYFTDGPDEQATRDAIAKFENETGATVNLQIVPFANLNQSLQARVSAGNAPEVARVADWHPYQSQLLDLSKYFGADYPKEFAEAEAKIATDKNGQMLAVPSDLTINGPFVNLDAFKKAGVDIPQKWTWDELVADATKVAEANHMQYPIAMDKSGNRLSTVLSQFGTTMIGEDGSNALDTAKATSALTFFTDLVKKDVISKDFWLGSGSRYAGANEIFLAQQAPVYLSGPWQVGAFSKSAKFKWGAAPDPCQERCGGFPGGKFMVAFSSSKEPTLGAAFVQWMNRTDNQKAVDQTAYWLPTRQDLVDSGFEYPDSNEAMSTFLSEIKNTPADTFPAAFDPAFTQAAKALIDETDKVVAGQEDVPTAVTNIKEGIDGAIKAAG